MSATPATRWLCARHHSKATWHPMEYATTVTWSVLASERALTSSITASRSPASAGMVMVVTSRGFSEQPCPR
jgi:hypothetical protein